MHRSQIRYRPPDDTQLCMQCLVVVGDAVVVLVERLTVGADQHRTERTVSVLQCDAGKLNAATQVLQIYPTDDHRPEVYGWGLAGGGQCLSGGYRLGNPGNDGRNLQCLQDRFAVDAGLAQGVLVGHHAVRTPVDR